MFILDDYRARLVSALESAGGEATSLFRLTVEADLEYCNAYHALRQLEAQGVVEVRALMAGPGARGKPLVMRLRRGHADRQLALPGGLGLDVSNKVKSFRLAGRRS
ncbi:MAG: hypothetical protein IT317_13690 [Anaerolineales bacterium]|nr:hypothetical protein [Anaerolineales bacterium]